MTVGKEKIEFTIKKKEEEEKLIFQKEIVSASMSFMCDHYLIL